MTETQIQKKVNKNKLYMGRVPEFAKEAFVERAKLEFDNNFGQCLAAMVKECHEFNTLKNLFYSNQLELVQKVNKEDATTQVNEKQIKFGNGKIKGGDESGKQIR